MDIFEGVGMGSSNIILLGYATAMLTSGSSGYVFEWLACANKLVQKWPNVKVCPQVPLWSDSVPGHFLRTV